MHQSRRSHSCWGSTSAMTRDVPRRTFLQLCATTGVLAPFLAQACSRNGDRDAEVLPDLMPAALASHLEDLLPQLVARTHVPGVSMVIIRNARIVWQREFGVADRTSGSPVNTETIFEAGSMSKPVFAYVVMKLVEDGVLDLDRPLSSYTGERLVAADERSDLLTTRHVLSHTSGLPNWRSSSDPMAFAFTPGDRWSYSGEGYSYLQSVVTRLTGRVDPDLCGTYEAGVKVCATDIDPFMRARMLTPLDMASGSYVWNDLLERHAARAHDSTGSFFAKGAANAADAARYAAAGGLFITPTDYARFLIAVVAPGDPDSFRLTRNHITEMLRPVVKVGNTPPSSWALGWQVLHTDYGDVIAHGGDNPGFHSFSAASVERGTGMVIMTNGDSGPDVIKEIVFGDTLRRILV